MIPARFNWLAPHYAWLEYATFGGFLHWCRTAQLKHLKDATRVLVLGEGDGRFIADFLAVNVQAVVEVVDVSPAMLELAQKRIASQPGSTHRVQWLAADIRRLEISCHAYDLIVTNFFLDCFKARELENLVRRVASSLKPGGRWLVGDFAWPDQSVWRLAAQVCLALMYACFKLITRIPAVGLVDPKPFLEKEGLMLEYEERRLAGFLVSRLWRKAA